jgi:hypothetical protein
LGDSQETRTPTRDNDGPAAELGAHDRSAAAAQAGVTIQNPSPTDPIVMLRHFGPGNAELAASGLLAGQCAVLGPG